MDWNPRDDCACALFRGHDCHELPAAGALFSIVLAAALVCLWRRRAAELRFAAVITAAVAVNQLLLLLAVMSASFRYEYLLVPAAAVCLVYALAALGRGRSSLLRVPD